MFSSILEIFDTWVGKRLHSLEGFSEDPVVRSRTLSDSELISYAQEFQEIVKEAQQYFELSAEDWSNFLSKRIKSGNIAEAYLGAIGLCKNASALDDLFGERVGGWGRLITSSVLAERIAVCIGWWVMGDLSRIGYLEAFVRLGESSVKQRMGLLATLPLNETAPGHPKETIQVLRHAITTENLDLFDAVVQAFHAIQDEAQRGSFLTTWKDQIHPDLLTLLQA